MKERDKKIERYLEERSRALKERGKEQQEARERRKRERKDYAVDEFPERKAVKRAFSFLFKKITKGRKRKKEGENKKKDDKPDSAALLKVIKRERKDERLKRRKERIAKWLNKGIIFCIFASLFFMPLVLVPITPSPVELPKQAILIFFTGLATLFWLGKMILVDKIEIKKSFLLVPVLAFVAAYASSGLFSVYTNLSVWGDFRRESASLLSLLVFVLFFFVVSNNITGTRKVRWMLFTLLFSSFIASIYATLQLWGIHAVEFSKLESRSVNTVGTIYASVIYFSGLAVLAGGLAVFSKGKAAFMACLVFVLGYLSFLASCYYKSIWVIFILAAGLMLAMGITQKKMRIAQGSVSLAVVVFIFALFTFLLGKPLFSTGVIPGEMLLGFTKSVKIAIQSVKEDPFLGSGPGTFPYKYELYKPNLGRLTSSGLDHPVSYLVLLGATTGFLTLSSYLFLLFVLSRFAIANAVSILIGKNRRGDPVATVVGVLWLFLTAMSFIYLNNMLLLFLWWFALAVIDINRPVKSVFSATLPDKFQEGGIGKKNSFQVTFAKVSLVVSILFVVYLACFSAVVYISVKRYRAAAYYQQALDKNAGDQDLEGVSRELERAVALDESRDLYARNMAIVYFARAKERVDQLGGSLSGGDSKFVSDNIGKAVISAERAIELNPHDFENYKNMAWVYHEMGGLDDSFGEKSLSFYKKALELSKRNPDLYYQIAELYLDMYRMVAGEAKSQQVQPGPKAREYLLFSQENLGKALEINKWHFGSNILLVTIYDLLEDKEKALGQAEKNWEMFNGNPQAGFSLAVQYYKRGEFQKARSVLELTLDLRPSYSNARYLLGFCLTQLGELEAALDQFERVQLKNPQNELLGEIVNDLRKERTDFLESMDQG